MTKLTCRKCGAEIDPLAVFPGGICLKCHAEKVDKLPPEPPDFMAALGLRKSRRSK